MKKIIPAFLQVLTVLAGIGVLTFLLWEPWLEGVNAHATTLYQIYFDDPFLWLIYTGAIPFFLGLYQTFRVLGYIRENKMFSAEGVYALGALKYCAIAIIGFVVLEEIVITLNHGDDDAAGAIAMGAVIIFVSAVIAANAAMHQKIWQKAADIKSENDLTV